MFNFSTAHVIPALTLTACFAYYILFKYDLRDWRRQKAESRRYNLPPGPPPLPIVGHLFCVPDKTPDDLFHSWASIYGDVIHLHFLGRSLIILDSEQAAVDLLEKRSAIYSCRPNLVLLKMMGLQRTLTVLEYGKQFFKHRRFFQNYFGRPECASFRPIQVREARVLASNLLQTSGEHEKFLSRFATAIVIEIAYGRTLTSDDDPLLEIASEAASVLKKSGPVGNTLVDLFPFLQHLPSWCPGTYYAQYGRKFRSAICKLFDRPFNMVMEGMANGIPEQRSFVSSHLDQLQEQGYNTDTTRSEIEDIKGAAGTMFIAGSDTTWSTLSVFLLAMLSHPECQTKVQEELDAVIGRDRLPKFEDRPFLPYLECVLQETYRWYPVTPLGVPHRSTEHDVYREMYIPKGSIVIANIKGMCRNSIIYHNPDEFNPSRYLPKPEGKAEPYPTTTFGFGRRICPGRHLADASIWIAIATILATLRISKPVSSTGTVIEPEIKFEAGFTIHPIPYQCTIRPRSAKSAELLRLGER